ncbi:hypothetical protein AcV5_006970 [Taiwanofungus camphoratus]|nr:hypothetical protein AcV5_006970 [Antrodia cinnamomea]KAI0958899.1 hypothetical protein AcV7_004586 [Antrodia cinnamomea]
MTQANNSGASVSMMTQAEASSQPSLASVTAEKRLDSSVQPSVNIPPSWTKNPLTNRVNCTSNPVLTASAHGQRLSDRPPEQKQIDAARPAYLNSKFNNVQNTCNTTHSMPPSSPLPSVLYSSDDFDTVSRPSSSITQTSALADCSTTHIQSDRSHFENRASMHFSPSVTLSPLHSSDSTSLLTPGCETHPVVTSLPSAPSFVNPTMLARSETSSCTNATPETPALVVSLQKIPALYDLPRADLENLVARVVREEGFDKLLKELDTMWRIKGFLGQS